MADEDGYNTTIEEEEGVEEEEEMGLTTPTALDEIEEPVSGYFGTSSDRNGIKYFH